MQNYMGSNLRIQALAEIERRKRLAARPPVLWRNPYQFYGNNAAFRACHDPIVLIAGSSETGKTTAALCLLHELAVTNPNLRAVMARKTRVSMGATVLRSWADKVLPASGRMFWGGKEITVSVIGGNHPEKFEYSNGSVVYVAGLDKSSSLLSGEFDTIYVSQAEELNADDIESLSTRVTGRAGNIKTRPPQLIMDCNPGGQKHPLKIMANEDRLTLFTSVHEDNPTLFNQETKEITEQGKRSLAILDRLTGVRYQRLRLGLWSGAQGLFFSEFDSAVHGLHSFTLQPDWDVWASMDYGFNHWNMVYFHARDNDGVIYTFHELAHRRHYPDEIAPEIHEALKRYGLAIHNLNGFFVGGDAFSQTGHSQETIAAKYAAHDIYLTPWNSGPGSRVAKAHNLLDLLGNVERKIPPRWFYVRDTCPKLAECLPGLVPSENNPEDVKKVNANESGEGGDDPYDALVGGLGMPMSSIA